MRRFDVRPLLVHRKGAIGFRDYAWRTLTQQGRASTAYKRGDLKWQTTLPVHKPRYRETLAKIEEVGWRQVERVDHPRVRRTDVTPRTDGGHDVTKPVTQDATFYFVRDQPLDDDEDTWQPQAGSSSWSTESDLRSASEMPPLQPRPGWYPTGQGLSMVGWGSMGPLYQRQPPPPHLFYGAAPTGMRPAEHALHCFPTFFTAGMWAPGWIFLAWRKRNRTGA